MAQAPGTLGVDAVEVADTAGVDAAEPADIPEAADYMYLDATACTYDPTTNSVSTIILYRYSACNRYQLMGLHTFIISHFYVYSLCCRSIIEQRKRERRKELIELLKTIFVWLMVVNVVNVLISCLAIVFIGIVYAG